MDNKIYELRMRDGITQEALAKAINITRGNLVNIENGKQAPKLQTAQKIARYFKVTTDEVFPNLNNKK